LFLLAMSLVYGAQDLPLRDYRESRFAELGRQVLDGPDWLVPQLNGSPYLNKPPLLPWFVAASFKILGRNEGAARVPVVVATLLTAAMVGWITARIFGKGHGVLGAVLFLGSPGVQYYGRMLGSDVLAMLWMICALAAFIQGHLRGGKGWYLMGFAACGLAVLSKGLLGLLYPVGSLALFLLLTDRGAWRNVPWVTGLAVFLAVTAPWFVAGELNYPGLLRHNVLDQQMERVVSQAGHPFVAVPRWEILLSFLGFLGPLVLLLPWSVGAFRGNVRVHRLLWLFGLLVVGSVVLSSGRNHPYTIPAVAALVPLAAGWLAKMDGSSSSLGRWLPACTLLILCFSLVGCLPWVGTILRHLSPFLAEPGTVIRVQVCLGMVALSLLAGGFFLARGRGRVAAVGLAAIMLPAGWMLALLQGLMVPVESRAYLSQWVAREIPRDWPIVLADPGDRQFEGTGGWGFYAGRTVMMVDFDPRERFQGHTSSRPDWIIDADGLMDMVISGRPLVLAATPQGLSRLSLGDLPPPRVQDAHFRLWVLHESGVESEPPTTPDQTGSTSSSNTVRQEGAVSSAL
jgi:4-amino-4-deoxy-L-arabinose transferase-like glycosyltransferase